MLPVILLTIFSLAVSGITTIPFSVGLLSVCAVSFKKSWVFFLALGLGLFLDMVSITSLGYSSLALTIFVFLIRLYEKKFETQTAAFVFISTFIGSMIYLAIFGYNQALMQALINALIAVLMFRLIRPRSIEQLE